MQLKDVAYHALPGVTWDVSHHTGNMIACVGGHSIILEENCFWINGKHYAFSGVQAIQEIRNFVRETLHEIVNAFGDVTPNGYMCGVDFQHEAGNVTVAVFDSVESCEGARKCSDQCGIVRVALVELDWPKPQNLNLKDEE
jgi:hypothetical protein